MNELLIQLQALLATIETNLPATLIIILGLWLIQLINVLVGYRLNLIGIYPRHLFGLIGIPFFSFLHGGFNHLFFNSIPLFVLINFLLIDGINKFINLTISIIVLSGTAIWLFGRRAIHIGASCLVMGYWGFLLIDAYQHPSILSVILAVVCLYYFGGLFFSVFPSEEKVSWEGHLFGLLAGLATNYLWSMNYLHWFSNSR